jgi:hypothetical protein
MSVQTSILAVGNTEATSATFNILSAATVTVGMYVSTGNFGAGAESVILQQTPGADIIIGKLSTLQPALSLASPGTYKVTRRQTGNTFGIFTEA